MKAINDNGTIKTFLSVPKSWRGKIGLQYANDSDLEALGFYNVERPALTASQKYGAIQWDADNNKFIYPIEDKTYTETIQELKDQKIANLKAIYNVKFSRTDWYIIRASEGGTTVPINITTERSDLRAECATKEAEINALNTKASIVNYELPNSNL